MGYTTDFDGQLTITPPLNEKQVKYINLFSDTRRMRRDVNKLMELYKGEFGNPFVESKDPNEIYGNEGEYFAREDGNSGQTHDSSILDYNAPPGQKGYDGLSDFNERWAENEKRKKEGKCQPGLWCQWEISDDGTTLAWDGGEKFYDYVEWLQYLISHFFEKWGVKLNGVIHWSGEDTADIGKIIVKDNVVKAKVAKITFDDDEDDEE